MITVWASNFSPVSSGDLILPRGSFQLLSSQRVQGSHCWVAVFAFHLWTICLCYTVLQGELPPVCIAIVWLPRPTCHPVPLCLLLQPSMKRSREREISPLCQLSYSAGSPQSRSSKLRTKFNFSVRGPCFQCESCRGEKKAGKRLDSE